MKIKIQKKTFSLSLFYAAIVLGIVFVPTVKADEVSVNGNGVVSNNQVAIASNTQTTIQQSNTAQINNTVKTTSNTGNNLASNNTDGTTEVKTGDANTSTKVNNSANNSTVTQSCPCPNNATNTAIISGNGAGSQNSTNVASESYTSVTIDQTATINNNIQEKVNTGNNSASNDGGNIAIHTGSISVNNNVANSSINSASVSVPSGANNNSVSVVIAGNGVDSINTNSSLNSNKTQVFENNIANIINEDNGSFNTGNNSANNNIGDVDIATGDIISETKLVNGPINVTSAEVVCCNQLVQIPPTQNQPTPNVPTSNTNQPATTPPTTTVVSSPLVLTSTTPGQVLGLNTGILPVTGNNWLLLTIIANVVMFFLGSYLRLHSGRSPGIKLAI